MMLLVAPEEDDTSTSSGRDLLQSIEEVPLLVPKLSRLLDRWSKIALAMRFTVVPVVLLVLLETRSSSLLLSIK